MRYIYIITISILLASCGPSAEEKKNIAAVTCSIMGETKNMDGAIRVEKLNDAREKIGGEPFLKGDDAIKEAFEYGLCEELILNENYNEALQPLKEIERIAAERREEEDRVEAERLAEEDRLEAERQKIADSKPTVKEVFYPSGKLKERTNHKAKIAGGKEDGPYETFHENGKLKSRGNYKDGKLDGLYELYYENGQLRSRGNYKDGKLDGLEELYYENGQLEYRWNYRDGKLEGPYDRYYENGEMISYCFFNDEITDMSYCKQQ